MSIFYRENMTSFLNYVTATLRTHFTWHSSYVFTLCLHHQVPAGRECWRSIEEDGSGSKGNHKSPEHFKHKSGPEWPGKWYCRRGNLQLGIIFIFLAHLSRRLEWAIVIAHRPSVRPSVRRRPSSVNFSHFGLLLQNCWMDFDETW